MNAKNVDLENDNLSISGVIDNSLIEFSSLIELANLENSENRRKALDNIGKPTKDIEPYKNANFLNMVGYFMNCL